MQCHYKMLGTIYYVAGHNRNRKLYALAESRFFQLDIFPGLWPTNQGTSTKLQNLVNFCKNIMSLSKELPMVNQVLLPNLHILRSNKKAFIVYTSA